MPRGRIRKVELRSIFNLLLNIVYLEFGGGGRIVLFVIGFVRTLFFAPKWGCYDSDSCKLTLGQLSQPREDNKSGKNIMYCPHTLAKLTMNAAWFITLDNRWDTL
jgi:hypothetical protein